VKGSSAKALQTGTNTPALPIIRLLHQFIESDSLVRDFYLFDD